MSKIIERVIVFMYGKTIEKINYDNYSDIISKDVAYIFLFMILDILTIRSEEHTSEL